MTEHIKLLPIKRKVLFIKKLKLYNIYIYIYKNEKKGDNTDNK
jgi:hypothetical protein